MSYGQLHMGFLPFTSPEASRSGDIEEYRVILRDVFGKEHEGSISEHEVHSWMGGQYGMTFGLYEIMESAGVRLEPDTAEDEDDNSSSEEEDGSQPG